MTALVEAVASHAARHPTATAIQTLGRTGPASTSWAELNEACQAVAAVATPLPRRSPLVLVMDGTAASVAVLLGTLSAGHDVVCVELGNSHLGDPGSALRRIATATTVAPSAVSTGVGLSYADLLGAATAHTATAHTATPVGPRRPGGVCQLTSGSTGEPRIVRHDLASIERGGAIYRDMFGYGPDDQVLLPIPMAHSFGMVAGLAASLLAGARLVTLERFSLHGFTEAVAAGASIALGTPLVYRLLGEALTKAPAVSRLRLALCSGAALPAGTRRMAQTVLNTTIRVVYGSTETGIIAGQPADGRQLPAGSTGVAAAGVDWRIEDGVLVVRTSTMFTGYLEPDGFIPFDPTGEYRTGDLARIDDSGVLWLTGRRASAINVGGRKISPERISRILCDHDAVREAHVYPVPGPVGEPQVHAAVVASGVGIAELTRYCTSRLAGYEVPRLHLCGQLPRSALGKVDMSRLLAQLSTSDHGETPS